VTNTAKAALGLAALFLAIPLAYSCWRWIRGSSDAHPEVWDWALTLKSTLAFALAFNLIFFIQVDNTGMNIIFLANSPRVAELFAHLVQCRDYI